MFRAYSKNTYLLRYMACALLVVALPEQAVALEFDYDAFYRGEYSNNVRLASDNEDSDFLNTVGVRTRLNQSSRRLVTAIETMVRYESYIDNAVSDDTLFNVNAISTWNIRPDRLAWVVQDYFSQQNVNSFGGESPNNRQDVNVFNTGPNVTFRLSAANVIQLEGRYQRAYYQKSAVDNNRLSALGGWVHSWSAATDVSLNVGYSDTDFDDSDNSDDYQQGELYAGFMTSLARTELLLNVGKTRIRPDIADSRSALFIDSSLTYAVDATSNVVARYNQNYSDGARRFLRESTDVRDFTQRNTQNAGAPFLLKLGEIFYSRIGPETESRVALFYRDENFEEDNNLDREVLGVRGYGEFNINPLWGVLLAARYDQSDIGGNDRTDDNYYVRTGVLYRAIRNLTASLYTGFRIRDSSNSANEYDELYVGAILRYR